MMECLTWMMSTAAGGLEETLQQPAVCEFDSMKLYTYPACSINPTLKTQRWTTADSASWECANLSLKAATPTLPASLPYSPYP